MKRLWVLIVLMLTVIGGSQAQEGIPVLPGKIALTGTDHNVYVFSNATGSRDFRALTADASSDRRYQWPTWSTDGRLAYFCCDVRFMRGQMLLETYISREASAEGKLIYEQVNEAFTYASWSPANCSDGTECRDLAVLVSRPSQPFKVEIIRDDARQPSSRSVGSGVPFYFSWSPDGTRLAGQINNAQFRVYEVSESGDSRALIGAPGRMQAPQWSPLDNRVLVAALNDDTVTSNIEVLDGDSINVLQDAVEGIIGLSWSPDGRYIAYSVLSRDRGSILVIIDAQTGDLVSLARAGLIVGFFWSPDSQKIAYVTPSFSEGVKAATVSTAAQQGTVVLQWHVLTVATEAVESLATFVPTGDMVYLLTYFDQFAQSHRLWSPDSRYLVYAEQTADGNGQVTVLDTDAAGTVTYATYAIGQGNIGVWSYD
jgi:TolB protein